MNPPTKDGFYWIRREGKEKFELAKFWTSENAFMELRFDVV